ncbi:Peroxisomal biogenesis factor [Mycena indigotica]|uniref:Peroxisomal biogenesis factor n=1 Tax=Mycena indigotica TaxID=2126181 RepID=A0A8H6SX41_9AGAR|nr:Peroxisomal biogenesis factor [Mycena indigotica]KAF7307026.1 Peroxisomal biogenesis factor [Mycena indigotica]
MSVSLASQVVLHPTVSQTLRLAATTVGRDKVYRLVQNYARFYAWFLLSRGHDKADIAKYNALKSHLGTARKLMRLGKPFEHLQAALRAALSAGPALEQLLAVARQLAYFFYLSLDALAWAHSIKFTTFKAETATKITKIANRAWLAGILLSIINAEAKLLRIRAGEGDKDVGLEADRQARLKLIATYVSQEYRSTIVDFASNRSAIRHQFIIDALDVWIPATALGLSNLNDGVVGIFGVISSAMALEKLWAAAGKN